jgi:hypothetical protein
MTKTTLRYEMKTCGRCGGGGRYSYCQMWGDVCFDCKGSGKRFSAAGAKARAAIEAFIDEHFTVPVVDVKVGDVVVIDGKRRTITGTASHASRIVDGVAIPVPCLSFDMKQRGGFTSCSHGFASNDSRVRVPLVAEKWDRVVEFARSIKRGVVIEVTETE